VDRELWRQRFAEHLRAYRRSEETVISYTRQVGAFLDFLAERGLKVPHELTREDVEAYQVSLQHWRKVDGEPLSLSSKNHKLSIVTAFVKFLRRSGVLLTDPTADIIRSKPPRKLLPELPTEDEVKKLLETPDVTRPLGLRDRAMLELLYSTAIRNGEMRGLEVGDVDFVRLEVRVRRAKGSRPRMVPLGEPAAAWVEEYLKKGRPQLLGKREHGILFCSYRGSPFNRCNRVVEIVREHAEAAGIGKVITPHTLRHCCATHMLARKAGLRHLQELLGHVSPSSTQIYTRVEISDLKEAHRLYHPRESF
jgi:integrase/recombinase XerD